MALAVIILAPFALTTDIFYSVKIVITGTLFQRNRVFFVDSTNWPADLEFRLVYLAFRTLFSDSIDLIKIFNANACLGDMIVNLIGIAFWSLADTTLQP